MCEFDPYVAEYGDKPRKQASWFELKQALALQSFATESPSKQFGNLRFKDAMKFIYSAIACIGIFCFASAATFPQGSGQSDVSKIVESRLPALGHRNWIVIADSAYPLQNSPGVETITVTEDQIKCVKAVLAALAKTKHVRPNIFLDKEIDFVPEKSAPGIDRYRKGLEAVLSGHKAEKQLHEDLIAKLDEAGKTFHILLIKTPLTIPYTTVFFQLQCGYWSDQDESDLREAMKAKG
ncbi:MAG TPA: RbsD/FucU domain-containing protein [Fimbriimonadaceae bacterium]|jgi:hypothetical protein